MAEKDFHISLPQEVGGFGWNDMGSAQPDTRGARNGSVAPRQAIRSASCGHSGSRALGASRIDGNDTTDVPAVRMSTEELDSELATEVKRNGAK